MNHMRNFGIALMLVLLLSFSMLSSAQLGEVAGQPHFNVSLGGSETIPITLINEGSTPINFKVILPTLNTIANTITPTVSASTMNGTIKPGSDFLVNVSVYMPAGKNKPGLSWSGVMQFVETSQGQSSNSATGAIIVAGVAKIVTITSAAPKFNIFAIELPIIALIVLIVAFIAIKRRRNAMALKTKSKRAGSKARAIAQSKRSKAVLSVAAKKKPKRSKPRRKTASRAAKPKGRRKRKQQSA